MILFPRESSDKCAYVTNNHAPVPSSITGRNTVVRKLEINSTNDGRGVHKLRKKVQKQKREKEKDKQFCHGSFSPMNTFTLGVTPCDASTTF